MSGGYAVEGFIEACSGSAGAVVSKCVSYPLDLMKVLLAAAGPDDTALSICNRLIEEKGILGLYTGIAPKLTKSAVQKFLFFYVYDGMIRFYRNFRGYPPGTITNIMIGFFADFVGTPFVVPLDFVTTQVQTSRTGESVAAIIRRTMREHGYTKFFDGWSGYVAGSWQPAVQFTIYDQFKVFYLRGQLGSALTALEAFLFGALAKAFSELVTYPTELVRIIQQSSDNKLRDLPFFQILQGVAQKEGLLGLYKGIGPQLAQGVLSIGIMMMVKEKVNSTVRSFILAILK